MPADSRVLIHEAAQDAIERLEALAEILSTDANVRRCAPQDLSLDDRTRKEIGLSIRVLLPKLRSVRARHETPESPRGRVCLDCED